MSTDQTTRECLSEQIQWNFCSVAYLHHLVEKVSSHAYKMQIVQALNPQDYNCRLAFVRDGEKVNNVWAHLHLSGFINKQNLSYCYEINPNSLWKPLHSENVTVKCPMSSDPTFWGWVTRWQSTLCQHSSKILSARDEQDSNEKTLFQQDGFNMPHCKCVVEFAQTCSLVL